MKDRRFIEETFPVKEISEFSAKEKSIRHGHISTLHIWWARRPLSASRSTAYAALIPEPIDIEERQRKVNLIIELSKWKNSLSSSLLKIARKEIAVAHQSRMQVNLEQSKNPKSDLDNLVDRPRILDPFAGGGSYPLEALRLGCNVHASDYNPVATLILKATLEYPVEYGQVVEVEQKSEIFNGLISERIKVNTLLEALRKWGDWLLDEARTELSRFYPNDNNGATPICYLWARTLSCQNPDCQKTIPLLRQFWLVKKKNKKIALHPDTTIGNVNFNIIGDGHAPWPGDYDPSIGSVSRSVVTCLNCGHVIDANRTRSLFKNKESGCALIAVVLQSQKQRGKDYRIPNKNDMIIFQEAEKFLNVKQEQLFNKWGINPVPDENIPSTMPGGFHTPTYGMDTWGELFNSRQKLALITFAEKIRDVYKNMIDEGVDPGFAKAITTYLALTFDRAAGANNTLSRWQPAGEKIADIFSRQALQMVWDYAEPNIIFGRSRSWTELFKDTIATYEHLIQSSETNIPKPIVTQSSATSLKYPDEYFDAVLTDPPYYYSVTYADLSDFFYVWLKRTIGHLYPELFSTPLTPKKNEIIEKKFWDNTSHQDAKWYEEMVRNSLNEAARVLKKNGIAVVVYAHKTTAGWETMVNALLDSGLIITGSWPVHTEMKSRLMAKESAALASSIYIIARKMPRIKTGFYNEVKKELTDYLNIKLKRLWEEGISGADFFIAAIGSAIEVFGKYEKVIDFEGNPIRADRLLEDVRSISTNYAVKQILQNGVVEEITSLTRLYVLWRWNYGEARVPFDEARKLAQSCGVDIVQAWNKVDYIRKQKEFVRIVGPQYRNLAKLENSQDMIDVLHNALLLWESGQCEAMNKSLANSGYGRQEAFYRVAQAISETLPNESKEKKLLDGFLAGRERIIEEVSKVAKQGRLFD
jgi:adenine-specific DNA methylase